MIVKSVTMISWELDPFHIRGGTAYAIRRLADQLTELGIETTVLLPDWLDAHPRNDLTPLLRPMALKMPAELSRAPGVVASLEFCRAAVEAVEEISISAGLDAVIAHSAEGAMFIVLRGENCAEPSVFWLHSLFDPSISDFSQAQRRALPSPSLLASAVMMADIVVTSAGVLRDAREFEWPERIRELQNALTTASDEDRLLTVESTGCLPEVPNDSQDKLSASSNLENVPSPYVLFPGRPTVDKGFGFFVAIAERLEADNIACVAVQRPHRATPRSQLQNVYWLPWLSQDELHVAMRNAACVVLPSITEGYGLAAAESISQGVPTVYQQVGGHHSLPDLPNALPVPLTTSEREQLYGLWSDLVETYPDDFWPVWSRHEISLRPLIDKWVEAIRSVVNRASGAIENKQFPSEERWGNKLLHRIEPGTTFNNAGKGASSYKWQRC